MVILSSMAILGYILAVLMGITLGLIGAGGSILTVPILVYFLQISPLTATTYSLLIVGITALIGAVAYYRKNLVDIRSAIIFAIPATFSVLVTRIFVVPNLPEKLLRIPKETFIMLLFALLMLVAAFLMTRPNSLKKNHQKKLPIIVFIKLVFGSLVIGFLTGIVGVGGGFLIVPTLVGLFGLGIKEAVATSLAIIATNALVGFKGDLLLGVKMDWRVLIPFIMLTVFGMLLGIWTNKSFDDQRLKKFFALFILAVALAIFIQEVSQY